MSLTETGPGPGLAGPGPRGPEARLRRPISQGESIKLGLGQGSQGSNRPIWARAPRAWIGPQRPYFKAKSLVSLTETGPGPGLAGPGPRGPEARLRRPISQGESIKLGLGQGSQGSNRPIWARAPRAWIGPQRPYFKAKSLVSLTQTGPGPGLGWAGWAWAQGPGRPSEGPI